MDDRIKAHKRHMYQHVVIVLLLCVASLVQAQHWVFNNPYPESQSTSSIYYASFTEQPKTLDPAQSYSMNEYTFLSQICEPLLQYDYFKRPYELVPLIASRMPEIGFLAADKKTVVPASDDPAYTVYKIPIKKGVFYQPHPAFAKASDGRYLYHDLAADYIQSQDISKPSDFEHTATRELTADDYIYQIKRLANPAIGSPIYGLMSQYILGFDTFKNQLPEPAADSNQFIDLRAYSIEGVKKLDDYTLEITTKGFYRPFIFWLAMNFFVPVPWEVDVFYAQPGMQDRNLSFDWYPVGTGPFMLTENNPNRHMVLTKNPNFRFEAFPDHGDKEDANAGYLKHSGTQLPMIDQAIFTLEKESIPYWNKFLQGYYDTSTISQDSFDQAIRISPSGSPELTPDMIEKKLHLTEVSEPTLFYFGFNMLDPVVGGYSNRARKLRQAISIAMNIEEQISIFYNGRGIPAQGPLPPGIFGFQDGKKGMNPFVYQWKDNQAERLPLRHARQLLSEAGYPKGIDPKTRKPLVLYYDVAGTASPQDKASLDWVRKQFAKLGIDLHVRTTLYNRFQEKMRKGNAQIFSWGWSADYPDAENFLFLLYGPNGKVRHGGENAANYHNPEFDDLFDLMKNRANDEQRADYIHRMIQIARRDAPWIWGVVPLGLTLTQDWMSPMKKNSFSQMLLKYAHIDALERNQLRIEWNRPVIWPLFGMMVLGFALILPLVRAYWKKQNRTAERMKRS